jgi:DNA polymerase-3 subunit gamma/tau
MTYQVLARKWRPHSFVDIVGQPYTVQALSNALTHQYLHHGYLFTGVRGVGKTTLARLLAKCLNCETGITATPCNHCQSCSEIDAGCFPDLYEVDAASRTKVDDTRELLDSIPYAPVRGRFKIYLIDEVHMLSGHSFNALLKTLEEPPAHVKFLLATTDYHKIPATVLSRCLQFHLLTIPAEHIADRCRHILTQEKISFEEGALSLLADAAQGSMRDALSLLDQAIAYGNGQVRLADVQAMLGTVEEGVLFDILEALSRQDGDSLLNAIERLTRTGADFLKVLTELLSLLHQIAVIQVVPQARLTPNSRLLALSQAISAEDVQLFYQIALMGQRDLFQSPVFIPRVHFEMTLLRMLAFYLEKEPVGVKPIQPKPAKVSVAPEKNEYKANQSPDLEKISWTDLLPKLGLTGAALALAEHCSLQSMVDSRLYLSLSVKQKPWLQERQIQRIEQALTHYFNKPVGVTITVSEQTANTPAQIQQQKENDQQRQAQETMLKDPSVQRLMKAFDATLVKVNPEII